MVFAFMEGSRLLFFFSFSCSFFIMGTFQLQSSQYQVLLQLRKQLEYPQELEIWYNGSREDLCYLSSSRVNLTCQDDFVTELRIVGDKHNRESKFEGYAIPYQTLSQNFSVDSLIATLSRLTSLRALTMVSLGIWGPIPEKIHRLNSLEHLDLSWNFLYGEIPPTISRMVNLHSLRLDGSFFNGSFPDWFYSLPNLSSLSLTDNRLSGSLPSSISRVTSLTDIALSKNEISGRLPDLSSLRNLHFLNLSDNKLDSRLPNMPKWLIIAFLGKNSFSGEIPKQYCQLKQLQQLDLSNNSLQGTPPAGLFSLPNLTYLNLASNILSGQLLLHLSCGNDNGLVDLSNNRLTGSLPSCLTSASGKKVVRYGGNCLRIDSKHQHPETYCIQAEIKKKNSAAKKLVILIGIIGGALVVLAVLAFGFLVLCRRYCPRGTSEQHLLKSSVQDNSVTGYTSELLTSARFIAEAGKFRLQNTSVHRLFTYDELKEATKDFDNSALLGEGSTGKIYRGRLQNGVQVAIRCITVSKKYTIRNLKLRLDLLAKLRHPHLVSLLGHCIDGEEKYDPNSSKVYLVYEYVPNGNYRSHLSENAAEKALKWSERLNILVSVAKAVHFLHTGVIPGFFSNRLRANNILLNEHKMAKLSDYGLSIVSEQTQKHEAKDEGPKSWQMKSLEDDAFSFGFILLESLVGPLSSARRDTFLLNEMASLGHQEGQNRLVDPTVLASSSPESRSIVVSLTSKCISLDSSARPSFEDILWNLQYAAQTQATEEGDNRSPGLPFS